MRSKRRMRNCKQRKYERWTRKRPRVCERHRQTRSEEARNTVKKAVYWKVELRLAACWKDRQKTCAHWRNRSRAVESLTCSWLQVAPWTQRSTQKPTTPSDSWWAWEAGAADCGPPENFARGRARVTENARETPTVSESAKAASAILVVQSVISS